MQDLLRLIEKEMSTPNCEEFEIDVRRKFVLQDALREGHKKKFSTDKSLKVEHVEVHDTLYIE